MAATPNRISGDTPLDRWLSDPPLYVAHRGGDGNWVEGTAHAYRQAAGWNPRLALEVPVWPTADGVWVVSEDATTGRVFGTDDDIRTSTWATLSSLRSTVGGYPMARLVDDILVPYGSSRILFIDNKSNLDVDAFFDVLDAHGGPSRFVSKSYYTSTRTISEARRRGYATWGYYYTADMSHFAATEGQFTLLGLSYSAPPADFAAMRATGKPVIAHIVATTSEASAAACDGVSGFMVSGVQQVVPHQG